MVQQLADKLVSEVDEVAIRLRAIGDADAAAKPRPEAWSTKEIVGHLVDSAANNQQRFVRAQQVAEFEFPGYAQDAWVQLQGYQDHPWLELIDFWVLSNRQLSKTIRRIPEGSLSIQCRIGSGDPVTLGFLVEDYLDHLRHHVKQIEQRGSA